MTKSPYKRSDDLRGAGQLTVDAIRGITDIVEAMHATILRFGGLLDGQTPKRTKGIPRLVYWLIRSIAKLVGIGIDQLLYRLQSVIGSSESSPNREAVISALNGVLGDYLESKHNPLVIEASFRQEGKPISPLAVNQQLVKNGNRLLIMVHGLCMNDLQWERKGQNHGEQLAKELGFVPLYLHYNTGLHISENGMRLANLLKHLTEQLPSTTRITFLTHSMGGLVTRSAFHFAGKHRFNWASQAEKLIFLGTPHNGALLEKAGNWIDTLLDANPYSAPFARLGKIRSAGITDMRNSYLIEDDWKGKDRFK